MTSQWIQGELFSVATPNSERSENSVATDPFLPLSKEVIERFWSQVIKGDHEHCWIWIGAISTPDGYGRISWQVEGKRRTLSAHRFALMLSTGSELPPEKVGDHECCEPLCVRVGKGHLRMTTQSENISYAVALGRHKNNQSVVQSHRRAQRSLRVREALKNGWDYAALRAAQSEPGTNDDQVALW